MHFEIIQKLQKLMREIETSVLTCPPTDYTAFREVVGVYKGLQRAIEEVKNDRRSDED